MRSAVIRTFLRVLFAARNEGSSEFIAWKSLVYNMSYRLPKAANKDRLIGFKTIFRVLTIRREKASFNLNSEGSTPGDAFITGRVSSIDTRMAYLKSVGLLPSKAIARSNLSSNWNQVNTLTLFVIISIGFLLAIIGVFDKQRANLALVFPSLIEIELIFKFVVRNKITHIHDFAQFEVDSNLLYLCLKNKHDLVVLKYPSPGPLMLHNTLLLTDTLCINTPYQEEEVAVLPYVRSESIQFVPPEHYLDYSHLYNDEVAPKYTLGYYSHGSWVREMQGHADDGLEIAKYEVVLLKWLNELLEKNEQYTLKILTHPKERCKSLDEARQRFYDTHIPISSRVFFAQHEKSTTIFNQVDIGIGVYSTILFERLYCGFKTLILPPNNGFPIENSTLNNICIRSESRLASLTELSTHLSPAEFFAKMEMRTYSKKIKLNSKIRTDD